MPLFWPTMPSDFPQDYVLAGSLDGSVGHISYVKCRWPSKHRDDLWELACFEPTCASHNGPGPRACSVLSTDELLGLMKNGWVIGTFKNGIVVTQG